ncbi:Branched-chain-amino-acid aminotransferase [Brevundimonas sp. NIBR10]|uniref:branched-chain amino acid aminotransferase n=1 Tax=Brevundimonas sp. NIBR10 TaxID=3015997 RepID=UPI0022F1CCBA|nr:branched-chain amino acid aminotransferase [Brevundimonas sp. NIBR10]WGM47393.1 Branched-chain-amino-acid aminotransferase [Brevundimonas sp. NIBR10]
MFKFLTHPAPTAADERAKRLIDPGFGRVFTDHMATIRWTEADGWHDAQIGPRQPFQIDPAASVLHYAQEIFEGMKAYRSGNGVTLFRPLENAARFARSAERLAMPVLPDDLFIGAIEALVRTEIDWIPEQEGSSLYLRPFMFANEAFLGVRAATEYMFCVIASPASAYFKGGAKPVKLWVSDDYTRAAPGGTGAAKCGGNYASSLVAQQQAVAKGCDQVVFLDAAEHRWVEELGGMNMFFVFDDGTLRTPPLGTILPGITRASILTLARDRGMTVEEAPYDIDSWKADAASGRLTEAFACGTAAVVAAVGEIRWTGGEQAVGGGVEGPVTTSLRAELTGIQRGERPDPHGWNHTVTLG